MKNTQGTLIKTTATGLGDGLLLPTTTPAAQEQELALAENIDLTVPHGEERPLKRNKVEPKKNSKEKEATTAIRSEENNATPSLMNTQGTLTKTTAISLGDGLSLPTTPAGQELELTKDINVRKPQPHDEERPLKKKKVEPKQNLKAAKAEEAPQKPKKALPT